MNEERAALLPQRLIDLARERAEQVWSAGSPLEANKQAAPDSLACERCGRGDLEEAVALSIGLSWRCGWLVVCDACYHELDYWRESEELRRAMIQRYRLRVKEKA